MDGQTDLTKLIGSFRNSVNAPKKASTMNTFAALYLAIQCDYTTCGHKKEA